MEFILRTLAVLSTLLAVLLNPIFFLLLSRKKPPYPPIRNKLLTQSISELILDLKRRKLTSVKIVEAYIERIKEVNPSLNAVIEDRFEDALKEARQADELIEKANGDELAKLYETYPLLGIPFTAKESCGVKGLSLTVGSIHRKNIKCIENGEVVGLLRSAGCIPLLASANPEFCLSLETTSHVSGRVLNPYDLSRTCAGSSGGEGALNGSGSTTFGVGSDLSGSIRLPAMFCGVFGHKPTGGLVSINGHFPNCSFGEFTTNSLQLGPITRFASDLPLLLHVMAGKNSQMLSSNEPYSLKDIKIYYSLGFEGLNGLMHPPVKGYIKQTIRKAVQHFEDNGFFTKNMNFERFRNSLEITYSGLTNLTGVPSIITQSSENKPSKTRLFFEFLRSLVGQSDYTKEALFSEFMYSAGGIISKSSREKLRRETQLLKTEIIEILGTNGVFFFPTFHTAALGFNMCILNTINFDLPGLFNILELPATQIPIGLNSVGLPIGFQVVAAPFQDKLCMKIALELEQAFGGWVPPVPHELKN